MASRTDYGKRRRDSRSRSRSNSREKRDKYFGETKYKDVERVEHDINEYGDNSIPKAIVTEENGEISCSIEETNRIRALLGMKPLNVGVASKEVQAVENFTAKREEEKRALETAALREKIEKAKNKRLLREKLGGATLSDVQTTSNIDSNTAAEDDTALLSAAEWVKRSRKVELSHKEKEKQKAALAAKRLLDAEMEDLEGGYLPSKSINKKNDKNENKYTASDLKGISVMHSVNDFDIGKEVILTLADSTILGDGDGDTLNEGTDILENVNMTETEKKADADKRAKRARQPVYSGIDDDEFEEGMQPGSKRSILSHYDPEKKRGPRIILGDAGVVSSTSAKGSSLVDNGEDALVDDSQLVLGGKKRVKDSLQTTVSDVNDFYTAAEYATFSKPKKDKSKKKERRAHLKKVSEGLDSWRDEESASTSWQDNYEDSENVSFKESIEALDASSSSNSAPSRDHGSRSKRDVSSATSAALLDESQRLDGWQQAKKNAADKSRKIFVSSVNTSASISSIRSSINSNVEDDDAEIAQSLARARRVALLKKNTEENIGDGGVLDDIGAARAIEVMQKSQNVTNAVNESKMDTGELKSGIGGNNDDDVDAEGRKPNGSLVFTSTTEFTARLQARLSEQARARAEIALKSASSSSLNSMRDALSSSNLSDYGNDGEVDNYVHTKDMHMGDKEENYNLTAMDVEKGDNEFEYEGSNESGRAALLEGKDNEDGLEDDQLGFVHQQPLVRRGMAATLALLQSTGELNNRQTLVGRTNDEREIDPSADDGAVKLEYRDEHGRKLTQKEAFRQLCYKFHGYGPGLNKREKRIKAMEQLNKAGSTVAATDKGTMGSLVKAQTAMGQAHITVQGGSNSATTSTNMAILQKKIAKQAMKLKEK